MQIDQSVSSLVTATTTKNCKTLPKGIRIGHVNARDICSKTKKDDTKSIIFQYDFDIFGISESWLTQAISTSEFEIPNYNLIRHDRDNIKSCKETGGGLLLYMKDIYKYKIKDSPFTKPVEAVKIK